VFLPCWLDDKKDIWPVRKPVSPIPTDSVPEPVEKENLGEPTDPGLPGKQP